MGTDRSLLFDNIILLFEDALRRNEAPDSRQRIHVGVMADDRARIEDAVASHFHTCLLYTSQCKRQTCKNHNEIRIGVVINVCLYRKNM